MQAIVTKYLPCTNYRQSRIKATAFAGSVVVNYDDALSAEENRNLAAQKLADKFQWKGTLHSAILPNGDTVHVFVN